jgi:hypothetical protein
VSSKGNIHFADGRIRARLGAVYLRFQPQYKEQRTLLCNSRFGASSLQDRVQSLIALSLVKLQIRRMTVETSTQNTSIKPRGRPSIDFTNMNILINNTTDPNTEKPTLVYDILCRDDQGTCTVTLTDEQKKDKYLLVIATTLTQLTAKGDKVRIFSLVYSLPPAVQLLTHVQQKNSHKHFRSSSGRLPPIGLEAYIAR